MILVIDNYDSFTFNLVQYLGELGAEVEVVRNDALDVAGIRAKAPAGLLVSPGPGTPDEAGVTLDAVRALGGELPIFGVCLGLQAIAQVYGGKVVRARKPMHGQTDNVHHRGEGVFEGLPSPFVATRYHSLAVEHVTFPEDLAVTAWSGRDGEIMGLRHRALPVEGVQFHPESFLTEHGHAMLRTFLARTRAA